MQTGPGFVSFILQDRGLRAHVSCDAFSGTEALRTHLEIYGWENVAIGAEVQARQGASLLPRVTPEVDFQLPSRKERASRAQERREVWAARAMDKSV